MITQRQIISGSSGAIFTIFSPNDKYLFVDDRSGPLFPIPQGTLSRKPIWSKTKCTIALRIRALVSPLIALHRWSVSKCFHKYSLGGDTTAPSRLYARLCHAFLVIKNVSFYSDTIAKRCRSTLHIVTRNVSMLDEAQMVEEGVEFTTEGSWEMLQHVHL